MLLDNTPPGLLPPNVEQCLKDTCRSMFELGNQLREQTSSLGDLRAESVNLGRRVKALQAAQKSHRTDLRSQMSKEIRRCATVLDEPLEKLRNSFQRQAEAFSKARLEVASALEGSGQDKGLEAQLGELRQVRNMGKALSASLADGSKNAENRMSQVLAAISGEAPPQAKGAGSGGGGEEQRSEAQKRKKGKKKGAAGGGAPNAPASPPSGGAPKGGEAKATASSSAAAGAASAAQSTANAAAGSAGADRARATAGGGLDEDSELRAEFMEAFDNEGDANDGGDSPQRALSGPELLQELQSLRSDAEALEARMAARLQARGSQSPKSPSSPSAVGGAGGQLIMPAEDPADKKAAAAAAARRKKKMYA